MKIFNVSIFHSAKSHFAFCGIIIAFLLKYGKFTGSISDELSRVASDFILMRNAVESGLEYRIRMAHLKKAS